MSKNIFEFAVRAKLRFPYKGSISTEDLWDLPVTELDKVFKTLNTQVKQAQEESLLNSKSREDEILEVQIEIVKYIVSVKLAEQKSREEASAKKAQREKIMGIIAEKQDEALHNSSIEDLQKMLGEIDG